MIKPRHKQITEYIIYQAVQINSFNKHTENTMSQAPGLMREKKSFGLYIEEVTVYWKSQPRNSVENATSITTEAEMVQDEAEEVSMG